MLASKQTSLCEKLVTSAQEKAACFPFEAVHSFIFNLVILSIGICLYLQQVSYLTSFKLW